MKNLKRTEYPHTLRQEARGAEILAKCRNLVLGGQNEYGELEWIGTYQQWSNAIQEELNILHLEEKKKEFKSIWR